MTERAQVTDTAQPRRVMIVDDEEDFALSIADVLEARGYEVEIAHSVEACRQKLERFTPHMVLTDIRLGRISGIGLIAELNKRHPDVVFVVMTAYATADTAIQAIQEGAYDYLRKPLQIPDLLATIDRGFEKIRLEAAKAAAEEELRQRNVELAESERRYRLLAENASDVIFTSDLQLNWTYISPSIEQLRGHPASAVMKQRLEEMVTRASLEAIYQTLAKAFAEEQEHPGAVTSKMVELEFVRPDGSIVPAEVVAGFLRDETGRAIGLQGVVRDITERQRAEEEQQRLRAELHEARRLEEIAKLTRAVAHETKNPLFAISSGIQVLQHELPLDDEQQQTFQALFQETMRVSRLVDQLVSYGEIKEYVRARADLGRIVEEVYTLHRGLCERQGIRLVKRPLGAAPALWVDRDKIVQVVINFVKNALEVSTEGDTIELVYGYDEATGRAVVEVRDQGPGIRPEHRDHIFDLFFSTKEEGRGMGLAISRKIIVDHDGDIRLEPREGRGVVASFTLPVEP